MVAVGSLVVTTKGKCGCGCEDGALKVERIEALVEGYIFTSGYRVFDASTLRECLATPSEYNAILPETDVRSEYMLLLEEYNTLKQLPTPHNLYTETRLKELDTRLDALECIIQGNQVSKL